MPPLRQRLIRLAYRAAQRLRRLWWRVARPQVFGAKAVVIDDGRRVLLVRHSYTADQWMLPGGGVKPGEDAAAAVLREIAEETGVTARDAVLHARFLDTRHGARNHISLFRCTASAMPPRIDGREIIAAVWHPIDALPANTAIATRRRIEEIRDGRAPEGEAWV
jgi:8-oxo-dGTP pyrophosphatase MutT (NUDIX family)